MANKLSKNSKKDQKTSKGNGFLLGALVGTVVGGVAGILTAPKSGKATRADIGRTGKKLVKKGSKEFKKFQNHTEAEVQKVAKKLKK